MKPNLKRGVTGPDSAPWPHRLCNHTSSERVWQLPETQLDGREKQILPPPPPPCHHPGLLSSHSRNFTPTLTSIPMLRRLVEGGKMIICCHQKSWQPPKISFWKLDCSISSSLITHKMYIYKVKTAVKWLTIPAGEMGWRSHASLWIGWELKHQT